MNRYKYNIEFCQKSLLWGDLEGLLVSKVGGRLAGILLRHSGMSDQIPIKTSGLRHFDVSDEKIETGSVFVRYET